MARCAFVMKDHLLATECALSFLLKSPTILSKRSPEYELLQSITLARRLQIISTIVRLEL